MSLLSQDIYAEIFDYIRFYDQPAFARVCRAFAEIVGTREGEKRKNCRIAIESRTDEKHHFHVVLRGTQIQDGPCIHFYKHGGLARVHSYEKGIRHGLNREFRNTGESFCESEFRKGIRHGKSRYWYPDGHLKEEETWCHGYPTERVWFGCIGGNVTGEMLLESETRDCLAYLTSGWWHERHLAKLSNSWKNNIRRLNLDTAKREEVASALQDFLFKYCTVAEYCAYNFADDLSCAQQLKKGLLFPT